MKALICLLVLLGVTQIGVTGFAASGTATIWNTGSATCSNVISVNAYWAGSWEYPSITPGVIIPGGSAVISGVYGTPGWIEVGYDCGGNHYDTGYAVQTVSVGSSFNIGCGSTNCNCPAFPGCSTNYVRVRIQNNSSQGRYFQLFSGSVADGQQVGTDCATFLRGSGPSFGAGGYLAPGQVGYLNYAQCQDTNVPIVAEMMGNVGIMQQGQGCSYSCGPQPNGCYPRVMGTNEYAMSQNPGVATNPGAGGGVSTPPTGGGWGNGSTNGIGFGAGAASDTNLTDQILMNGFGALYAQGAQIAQELQTLLARSGVGGTNGYSITVGGGGTNGGGGGSVTVNITNVVNVAGSTNVISLTNVVNVGGSTNFWTNVVNLAGLTNAITNVVNLGSLSNLIQQLITTEGGASNLANGTYNVLFALTNLFTSSTNYQANGTNLLGALTNVETGVSNVLSGMSNIMAATFSNEVSWVSNASSLWQSYSNSFLNTNNLYAMRDSYAGPLRDAASSQQSGFAAGVANGDSGAYAADSAITLLSFVDGGVTYTLDLDPLHDASLLEIWSLVKGVFWWWVTMWYYVTCVGWAMRASREVLIVPQSGWAKMTIFGNDIGVASAPIFIVVIMTAIAAVGQVLVSWLGGAGASLMGSIRADPLIGHPGLSTAIAWFNAVVPWQYAFGLVLTALAYRWQIFGIYTLSAYLVKCCMK